MAGATLKLDPGPIPPLAAAGYETPFPAPGLADWVQGQLSPLDDVENALDAAVDPAAAILDELPSDDVTATLDYTDAIFAQTAGMLGTVPVDQIDANAAIIDQETLNAFAMAPAEAFEDVPAQEVPWTGEAGAPPPTPTQPTDAAIQNISRPGASDIAVGDQVQFNLHIHPNVGGGGNFANVHVFANVFIGGATYPGWDLGVTNEQGFLSYDHTFSPSEAGDWHLEFYGTAPDGSNLNLTDISFSVVQQAGRQAVTVALYVQEYGYNLLADHQYPVHVGWHFQLTVTGRPNAPVVISGTYQGNTFAPVTLGNTDPSGNFVLGNVWDSTAEGDWVERYSVGGVDWGHALEIEVQP